MAPYQQSRLLRVGLHGESRSHHLCQTFRKKTDHIHAAAAAGLVSTELRAGVLSVFTLLIYLGQTLSPPFFALFIKDSAVRPAFFAGSAVFLLPIAFTIGISIRNNLQKRAF